MRRLDDANMWALDERAKIQFVYAFQSLYAEKARVEFLEVSRETQEVKTQNLLVWQY